jgi:hypothetical protein
MRRGLAAVCILVGAVASAQAPEGIYRNTPWFSVPATGPLPAGTPDTVGATYQLAAIPLPLDREGAVLSRAVLAWKLSIDGGHGALQDPQLRLSCFIAELPEGTQIGDPAWVDMFMTAKPIKMTFVYRVPSGALTSGKESHPVTAPYPIEAGKQLFLVAQLANRNPVGSPAAGPVTCVSTVEYLLP